MKEAKLTKEFLDLFIKNLRFEDKQELNELYKDNSFEEFYEICLNEEFQTYFLTTNDDKPLALGGAFRIDEKSARIWLLVTNEFKNNKISLFKYVKNKIDFFKNEYEILYNYIFESNFDSLVWLKSLGFKVLDLKIPNYKMFYYKKGV